MSSINYNISLRLNLFLKYVHVCVYTLYYVRCFICSFFWRWYLRIPKRQTTIKSNTRNQCYTHYPLLYSSYFVWTAEHYCLLGFVYVWRLLYNVNYCLLTIRRLDCRIILSSGFRSCVTPPLQRSFFYFNQGMHSQLC